MPGRHLIVAGYICLGIRLYISFLLSIKNPPLLMEGLAALKKKNDLALRLSHIQYQIIGMYTRAKGQYSHCVPLM
jgi:hypothetical protein